MIEYIAWNLEFKFKRTVATRHCNIQITSVSCLVPTTYAKQLSGFTERKRVNFLSYWEKFSNTKNSSQCCCSMVGFQLEFIVKLSHSFMLSYQVGAGIVIGLYFSTYIRTSWNWFPISPKKLALDRHLQNLLSIFVLLSCSQ